MHILRILAWLEISRQLIVMPINSVSIVSYVHVQAPRGWYWAASGSLEGVRIRLVRLSGRRVKHASHQHATLITWLALNGPILSNTLELI